MRRYPQDVVQQSRRRQERSVDSEGGSLKISRCPIVLPPLFPPLLEGSVGFTRKKGFYMWGGVGI